MLWQTTCHIPAQIPTIAMVAKKSSLQFFLPKKLVFQFISTQNTLQIPLEHQDSINSLNQKKARITKLDRKKILHPRLRFGFLGYIET
jgi:hypothetical protein